MMHLSRERFSFYLGLVVCLTTAIAASQLFARPHSKKPNSKKAASKKESKKYSHSREWKSNLVWPEPKVVDPGPPGGPPSDAIVLFDGTSLDAWEGGDKWIIKDGAVEAHGNSIVTKQKFGDCQLHVEYAAPPVVEGEGQGRGNSGIFLMSNYEIQLLDSYDNETYYDGQAAAVYKTKPPLVNVCRPPGEWQTYDIVFTAPRFDADGKLKRHAYVTVMQNGVVVQNHTKIKGTTYWHRPAEYEAHPDKMPLQIQYHRDPVRFRNIWIRELGTMKSKKLEAGQ